MIQSNQMEKTSELILMPYASTDAPKIATWAEDPKNAEFFRHLPPLMTWSSIDKIDDLFGNTFMLYYNGALIGCMPLSDINHAAKSAHFSLLIDLPDSRKRRQLTVESTHALEDYVFDFMGFNRLACKIMPHRASLKAILLEDGYKLEGELQQSCRLGNVFHNELIFAKLKGDRNGAAKSTWNSLAA